ncbi:MAG: sigma-70 family RNA polymerase sigma factor [Lautropia sp.]
MTDPDVAPDDADDARWMKAFAAGDAKAFESLYDRHRTWLYRVILRQVRDETRAQEIYQEVWLAVVRQSAQWRPQARFRTWLYTIARSRIIDGWRGLKPDSPHHPLNKVWDEDDEPAGADDPASLHERRDLDRRIRRSLADIPFEQREVFLLNVEGGMPLSEIATIAGCTLEAAKSRLRYARAKLAAALQDLKP